MNKQNNQAHIISTSAGKGGVGKSLLSVNLAEMLVSMGHRVALIDADLGLSNCAMLLNESVPGTAHDVATEKISINDIMHITESGLTLITGSETANYKNDHIYPVLDNVIMRLRYQCDYIIIDTPAGATEMNLWALDRSDLSLLILVNEPTVISDVYRFCKFIMEIDPSYPFATVVNFAADQDDAEKVAKRFNSITSHFLDREFPHLGHLPLNEKIRESVMLQKPFVHGNEHEELISGIRSISDSLISHLKNIIINQTS
jgi:flagellar biosynthesis protein FlhG